MMLATSSTSTAPPPLPLAQAGAGTLPVSAFQERVLDVPAHLNLALTGGRGGAKTRAAALLALVHLSDYGATSPALWLRRTHRGLADATTQLLEVFAAALGPKGFRFNANEGLLRLPNGGVLELNQLSAPSDWSKYQGRSIGLLIVDEGQQWATPALLDRMRSNLRGPAGVPSRIVLCANPGDVGHAWIAKRHAMRQPWEPYGEDWLEGEATGRLWLTCPSTLADNPFIDQAAYRRELAAACSDDPALLQAWLDGDWSVVRGAYFADVLSDANVLPEWPEDLLAGQFGRNWAHFKRDDLEVRVSGRLRAWLALDFGSSAPSVCYLMIQSGGLEVGGRFYRPGSILAVDEVALAHDSDPTAGLNLTVPEQAREFLAMAARWGVAPRGCADDACFSQHGHEAGSIADEFRKAGLYLDPAGKGGRVAGWQLMRTLLRGASTPDQPGLYISRRCRYAWATLPYLMRSPKRREDVDTDGPDHGADSLRYGCGYVGSEISFGKFNW